MRWFGNKSEDTQQLADARDRLDKVSLTERADEDLLEKISDFLLGNKLRTTQSNLIIAHSVFSGETLGAERLIAKRLAQGEKIDQSWLDAFAAEHLPTEHQSSDALAATLERSVLIFEQSSSKAREATQEYGQALTVQSEGFTNPSSAADIVMQNLAEIAKSMIERTARIEQQMADSQSEAAQLRRSLEKARRDAELDHLTGLPNRRAFEGVFETQHRIAQTEIEPLTVAFCDIDHFKKVNDVHGHDTGDRVIQAVAQMLARISNDRCHVARHGGEEFVLLFRGITLDEARDRLDATRENLAARRFVNRQNDEPIGQISFSAGLANVFAYHDRRLALKAADEALYRAKAQGRNCVLVA